MPRTMAEDRFARVLGVSNGRYRAPRRQQARTAARSGLSRAAGRAGRAIRDAGSPSLFSPVHVLPLGLFDRKRVEAIGGYSSDTVGEDMELVVRLHRHHRERRLPYRIRYLPDPICWTEAPETLGTLGRRWGKERDERHPPQTKPIFNWRGWALLADIRHPTHCGPLHQSSGGFEHTIADSPIVGL